MDRIEARDCQHGLADTQDSMRSPDANVEKVRQKLLDRSKVGLAKYGVTTERDDLNVVAWLRHLQEELLDAAVYVEAAVKRIEGEEQEWM